MPKLLEIDSSPLYGRSVSRQLTDAFVAQWKSSHPDGTVVDRDLNATVIPPVTAEWVGAAYTPEDARTPQQKDVLALSDTLIAELEQADEFVHEAVLLATSLVIFPTPSKILFRALATRLLIANSIS